MPSLYSLYEGSLEIAARHRDALLAAGLPEPEEDETELTDGERAVKLALEQTWRYSGGLLGDMIFHRDADLLVEQVGAVSAEAADLLDGLVEGGVLGALPLEFGFRGSLAATEVVRLRRLLEDSVADRVEAFRADRNRWDERVDPADPLDGPTRVVAGLRGVGRGLDLALRL